MDEDLDRYEEYAEDSVGAIYDTVEMGIWQAERLARRGFRSLAAECLRTAWHQYLRFVDVLKVYAGGPALHDRLLAALLAIGDGGLVSGLDSAQILDEERLHVTHDLENRQTWHDMPGVIPDDLLAFASGPVKGVGGGFGNELVPLGGQKQERLA